MAASIASPNDAFSVSGASTPTPDHSPLPIPPQVLGCGESQLKLGVWNVGGWGRGLASTLKTSVLNALDLDILCVCETFLLGQEVLDVDGYVWLGNN